MRRVFNDVGNDPHRRFRRIDVGVADHELFEDVVLDRARELILTDTLLLAGNDVTRQNRQHRAVHGHRHAHLIQRNAIEQDLHVLDGVDGHAGFTNIAKHPWMITVVSSMCRKIEGDGEPHLPSRKVGPIERVGFFSGREAGVLTNRPRTVRVHRGSRASQEGTLTWNRSEMLNPFKVGFGVQRLYIDALGRTYDKFVWIPTLEFSLCGLSPGLRIHVLILRGRSS